MIKGKSILALIPARSGSKGLPGKNIKVINGKPLIEWSIVCALKSKYIDKVIVSTDSKKIASISKKYKAEIPFIRPKKLSTDKASSMDVIFHCVNRLEQKKKYYDLIVLLEPTSPLRDTKDIDTAIEMLLKKRNAESIVGVCKVESAHPDFLIKLEKSFLRPYKENKFKTIRRQDISDLYFFEGSLYISYIESLKKHKTFYHKNTLSYIVPKWKSFELDDITDFFIIEALLKAKKRKKLK
ncbi:MAG: acylneuraminate cytidylyltransferase family protein [Ignavibacteriae bacterium]|nr:acylneuraminate cytidylyltransferase family protein [Ignavibacteriota bacterium]